MNKFTITGIVLGGIGGALFGNYCFENNIPYLKEKKYNTIITTSMAASFIIISSYVGMITFGIIGYGLSKTYNKFCWNVNNINDNHIEQNNSLITQQPTNETSPLLTADISTINHNLNHQIIANGSTLSANTPLSLTNV